MKTAQELKELRTKDSKSLYSEIGKLNAEISELKFKATFKKLKNFRQIRQSRKNIARIWTILTERAIDELEKVETGKNQGVK